MKKSEFEVYVPVHLRRVRYALQERLHLKEAQRKGLLRKFKKALDTGKKKKGEK